jgi:Kinesin motor domain
LFKPSTGKVYSFQIAKKWVFNGNDRYAVTIFAFGQTGSGKTFTITGPEGPQTTETVGIVPRALEHVFAEVASSLQSQRASSIRVQASYLEIYNEHVRFLCLLAMEMVPISIESLGD